MTNMQYDIEHKVVSTKGYTLGARTAPRFGGKEYIVSVNENFVFISTCLSMREFGQEFVTC